MLTQTVMTLLFGTAADAQVPELGASGTIAAVLGAYFVLYPGSRVLTYIVPVFLVKIPAWVFLGLWFLYQLIEANFGLFSASANGGGVAFFAHVGGFVFGLAAARVLIGAGRVVPQTRNVPSGQSWKGPADGERTRTSARRSKPNSVTMRFPHSSGFRRT
jgi:membrane associated rhomboid family serine protease